VPESRERRHSFENGNKHQGSSLEIPHEDEFDNTSDVTEEDSEGQHNLGVARNRRMRSYSIKGDTGDVTDGRIVV
jgi:hypothetical protein